MPYKNRRSAKAWRKLHPLAVQKINWRWGIRKHQISLDQFYVLLKSQRYRCALCNIFLRLRLKGSGNYICAIDHDHGCKRGRMHFDKKKGCPLCIRGLVCKHCNVFIVPGLEFLHAKGLYTHPYLMQRPLRKVNGI